MLKKLKEKAFLWSLTKQHVPTAGNWHVDLIIHLASVIKPKVYVELGLYQCELFNKVLPFADRLIGVDLSNQAGQYMRKSPKATFINSTTQEYCHLAKSNGLSIDMLFIDANHSYQSVMDDFHAYFPLVKDDGIILLHDGYPKDANHAEPGYCGDCYKAIEELSKSRQEYEMVTIPTHPGLTVVRKRLKQIPW